MTTHTIRVTEETAAYVEWICDDCGWCRRVHHGPTGRCEVVYPGDRTYAHRGTQGPPDGAIAISPLSIDR